MGQNLSSGLILKQGSFRPGVVHRPGCSTRTRRKADIPLRSDRMPDQKRLIPSRRRNRSRCGRRRDLLRRSRHHRCRCENDRRQVPNRIHLACNDRTFLAHSVLSLSSGLRMIRESSRAFERTHSFSRSSPNPFTEHHVPASTLKAIGPRSWPSHRVLVCDLVRLSHPFRR